MKNVFRSAVPTLSFAIMLLSALSTLTQVAGAEPPAIDFGRDIRPILSDKCFLCHGPDEAVREAGLRLDVRQEALDFGAIVPQRGDESELLARVQSQDPELVMPPPSTGKSVSAEELTLLKAWIEQGAEYSEHWAFQPPQRPSVPEVENSQWARNAIDHFVLKQQQAHGLSPSPPADPRTLLRRLQLDLVGLPPSPAELASLENDSSIDALDQRTEHLLASEHFGERWARWWLDAARYADSDGYEKDKPRSVWFYRDWVIRALNQNMPYDQFVIEQIAGDLLPKAGQSQRVATGFLRNSMVNEEGGADPEQFRIEGMFDRMDAIGKAILGITTQCAQCHTHKYDPLSHAEYYQMFAALNDFHDATITVFTPEQAAARDSVYEQVLQREEEMKRSLPDWREQLQQWSQSATDQLVAWQSLRPYELPYEGQKFRLLDDDSIVSESYAPTKSTNSFPCRVSGERITAFRLDALMHPQLPRGGPGRSVLGTGAVTEFEVTWAPADQPDQKHKVKLVRAMADANPEHSSLPAIYRDRNPEKDERVTGGIDYAIDGNGKTAWSTDVGPGRRNRNRVAVFVPESPIEHDGEIILSFTLKQNHGGWNSDDNQNYLLGRYRFSVTDQPIGDVLIPAEVQLILQIPTAKRTADQTTQLFRYWRTTVEQWSESNEKIESLWAEFPETDSQLVVEAREQPRPTFVFSRGDFLSPAEPVQPAAPEFLGALPDTAEPARLRFARWLVRDDAPTTARVIVNRIWQSYFGRGLVDTPEDFGFQSSPPSHPMLLDWLACELVENDWNLKHIHRLIVDSATYRQCSVVSAELLEQDPTNRWLARGPRVRVDAEIVRDIALEASGLLNRQVGGPSVYPPAPDFLFEPPASYGPKTWATEDDDQQFRRSLYIHQFRSVPFPALQVFDAPKGDAACIRRERSNTPLQALVLLNEPQFVQCARAMAGRILREADPSDAARLDYAFELSVGRRPTESERGTALTLLEEQRSRIAAGDIDLAALLGADPLLVRQLSGIDADELAAWTIVARALLNLDETITKS